ncbi:calcitonin gene-related peptide type 1 receptor [Zeugodacus cucurbitae]|uniref:calcitonin gene-related peptide type 1 receptor n=1 Tax=Zeugodacus cucurbitae TaxID=28588 RepID=UPI0023D95F18|nr:calcitonin gene-related peptide type 1 receptor [Zeugodacus cucurbitae]XP_054087297.1 calcitonin gene-related peptide type 1 receptor [Zeugodacus cucurbitae]
MAFLFEPFQADDQYLREFLSHLYLNCIVRYQNETGSAVNDTDDDANYIGVPRYLEEAVLNEGSIDLSNVDEAKAEQNELFAYISKHSLKPLTTTTTTTAATTTSVYNNTLPSNLNESYPYINNIIVTSTPATSFNATANGTASTSSATSATAPGSSPLRFCPLRFDGYLCWPRTPAGTVLSQYCPDFVEGFNRKFLAHKTCLENGTWYHHPVSGREWSNYTNCIDYDDLQFRSFVNELYVKGYIVSLIALLLSLIIFLGFKSLRCTRIRIHVHLFASLAFTCIAWILWYKFVVEQPDLIGNNPPWCIILHLVVHYFMLVNYFWMFCEGLHLHLVLVVVFVKDTIVMRWFKLFAWMSPILVLMAYGAARFLHTDDNTHCWMDDSLLLWILSVPICASLLASFVFLINVLRVIVRKLHPQSAQPAPLAIRKAVRATIILIPLFGLQHSLLPYRPDTGTPLERFYQILSVILVSLQGFVVSFLFCFANHDVTFAIRTLLNRLMPALISPPPPGTHTGQMATTTPSRELGV